ncbi:hypothetical protein CEUSTIGMA_g5228.t1 [Chlamydomonas eustigma]|uniref:Uncharacterized protein n=1 Tax=Chlamydomonas eustigma TaxID=1157962 RepID=A0A250X3Y7_9CHLO|nr:hypothetical protein CEUSTIGMA_g5228.t1 [Chlamydomonas eustigma]|eukprot:GAX77785.1 hypothetical protein CEUSTIGMA_g5228.t1 [Chlamydomonas eustigma]
MDVCLGSLLAKGLTQQATGNTEAALTRVEAEHLVETLQPLSVEDVGGSKWQAQHQAISRLNVQAHYNARTHSDEFVVELLVSHDRVKTLVHDLLAIEAWRELVLPHLEKHIAQNVDSVSTYMLLYHECMVTNLLEITLFHSNVSEAIPEEHMLELADWVYRKVVYLNSKKAESFAEPKERSAADMMAMTELEELHERARELEFASAMGSLSVLRYLTEFFSSAPMGLLSRMVSSNDTLMALLPLLERPPWVRRRGGKTERWCVEGGMRWTAVEAADRLKLGQYDIQVWLAINNLSVDPRARAKYNLDNYRKERLLGLKRYLNELLFDQLPVLKDLQRVLDELGIGMTGADKDTTKQAGLILEQVPVVREYLVRGRNWKAVAAQQTKEQFARGNGVMDKARMEALSKLFDQMCDMEIGNDPGIAAAMAAVAAGASPETAAEAAAAAGQPASLALVVPGPICVECRRKVHDSGVFEPWCDFEFKVDASKAPDPVEVAGPVGSSGQAPKVVVHGLRYKLEAVDPTGNQPLPSSGKIVVKVQLPGPAPSDSLAIAEALLQLPEASLREEVSELPPIVWLTVGLLASDGIALQLKLRRADKAQQRDRISGVWYAYHPCGGALTVKRADERVTGQGVHAAAKSLITPMKKSGLHQNMNIEEVPRGNIEDKAEMLQGLPVGVTTAFVAGPIAGSMSEPTTSATIEVDLNLPD